MEPLLIENYVKTGKITLEYRDYIVFGEESMLVAEAAACANDQEAFWPFHDTLFANQASKGRGMFEKDGLDAIARMVGLDVAAFATCLSEGRHRADITAMVTEGQALGVTGTPALFVNGERIKVWDYESLAAAIETSIENPR